MGLQIRVPRFEPGRRLQLTSIEWKDLESLRRRPPECCGLTGTSVCSGMRTLILSLLSLPLFAADLQVRDIRIEAGRGAVSGYDAEYRYTAGPGSQIASGTYKATDYDGDGPITVSAMYVRANLHPVGFLWAVGVEWQNDTESVGTESFDSNMVGAKGRLGVGWCPVDRLRLEATIELQLGYVSNEDADVDGVGNLDRDTATGSYQAYGVQLSGGYVFAGHWEVGASVRGSYYSAQTSADFSRTGGSYDADFSWSFFSAAATIAYRF